MQYCVYGHALSCTELAFRHATETHLGLKWKNKDKEKKLAVYRSWPWISNCWEWDPNSRLSGLEASALTTRTRRRYAYCSSTNQCLQILTTEKKTYLIQARCLSGTSNYPGQLLVDSAHAVDLQSWSEFAGTLRCAQQGLVQRSGGPKFSFQFALSPSHPPPPPRPMRGK